MPQPIRPADIIRKYYNDHPLAWEILLEHSRLVTRRASKIARFLAETRPVDLQFVAEAAMLHDIGMLRTDTPEFGCNGEGPYICHGIKGREMLEDEGLYRHALVCERHIGIGLSAAEIIRENLPLPQRDMRPKSLEEQIICYADLFYSKSMARRNQGKTPEKVKGKLAKYGAEKIPIFTGWLQQFEPELG